MCTPTPTQPQKEASSTSVADLDLQIRGWGGGGRGGHPDPEIRESPGFQENFFRPLRASVWSKNREVGGSPGSATAYVSGSSICIFVPLCVRMSLAGANKVEGTMS